MSHDTSSHIRSPLIYSPQLRPQATPHIHPTAATTPAAMEAAEKEAAAMEAAAMEAAARRGGEGGDGGDGVGGGEGDANMRWRRGQ